MHLNPKVLAIDPPATAHKLVTFIQDYVAKAHARGVVLGLSGGLDSATAAALATHALGGKRVLGLYMPEDETASPSDQRHVRLLATKFQFQLTPIDLTAPLHALYHAIPDYDRRDRLSRGNLKARTRMLIWYYYANRHHRLAIASSDKSETLIGYFTKWGDHAADLAPLLDLYKTQVRQLARHLGIPPAIVKKPPTPALWHGQTAEDEIGLKYDTLDLILYGLEHFMPTETIAKQLSQPLTTVTAVKERWLSAEHKRQMPLTPKLAYRTVGHDLRLGRAYARAEERTQ